MCDRPIRFFERRNLFYLAEVKNIEFHYKIKKNDYAVYRKNICKSLTDDFRDENIEEDMLHELMVKTMMLWIKTRDPDLEAKVMNARLENRTEYTYDRVLKLFAINALSDRPIIG